MLTIGTPRVAILPPGYGLQHSPCPNPSTISEAQKLARDWKPTTHFGITAGYNLLYFKLSHTVGDRTFTAKQTLHGPIVGIGFYF